MSEELKPCPFCGSDNIDPEGVASFKPEYRTSDMNWEEDASKGTIQHRPACADCGATTEENWNTRADQEQIEGLGEALGELDMVIKSAFADLHAIKKVEDMMENSGLDKGSLPLAHRIKAEAQQKQLERIKPALEAAKRYHKMTKGHLTRTPLPVTRERLEGMKVLENTRPYDSDDWYIYGWNAAIDEILGNK